MLLTRDEIEELRAATAILEKPGVAWKLTDLIGVPVEKGFECLPIN